MAGTKKSKRSASTVSVHESKAKRAKRSSALPVDAESEEQRSRLLELPTELFQIILGEVAEDSGAFLSRKGTGLRSNSGLMCVSRAVHDEYQSILNVSASTIHATVLDFDFSHIVRFLNRLTDRELKALPTVALPTQRKFVITLTPTKIVNPEKLQTWLLRLEHPSKRGAQIEAEYAKLKKFCENCQSCESCSRPGYDYCLCGADWNWPISKTLIKWIARLEEGTIEMSMKYSEKSRLTLPGRLRDEVIKIATAISRRT